MYLNDWQGCTSKKAGNFDDIVNNKRINTLAGWSLGRMGPIYFLRDYPERSKKIHYILLLDPGSLDDLQSYYTAPSMQDCIRKNPQKISAILKKWLDLDPQNRLVIMAGKVTQDKKNMQGRPYAHQGLHQVYFQDQVVQGISTPAPAIRGTSAAQQVRVCDYDNMSHFDVFNNFKHLMDERAAY